MQPRTTGLMLSFMAILFVATGSNAQNSMFLRDSPIASMNETDRKILRSTLESLVRAPDGTETQWFNPDTGSKGELKAVSTYSNYDTTCRAIRFRNESRGRKGSGEYHLCLADDDTWKFAPKPDDN